MQVLTGVFGVFILWLAAGAEGTEVDGGPVSIIGPPYPYDVTARRRRPNRTSARRPSASQFSAAQLQTLAASVSSCAASRSSCSNGVLGRNHPRNEMLSTSAF